MTHWYTSQPFARLHNNTIIEKATALEIVSFPGIISKLLEFFRLDIGKASRIKTVNAQNTRVTD